MILAAKTGTIYVINRDNMGHFHAGSDSQIIQSLPGILPHGQSETGNYSAPAFFNGSIYFAAVNDTLKAFQISNGLVSNAITSQSLEVYPNRGGSFAISANGNTNGIVWATQDNNPANGVLYAYDATNLWQRTLQHESGRDSRCAWRSHEIRHSPGGERKGICGRSNSARGLRTAAVMESTGLHANRVRTGWGSSLLAACLALHVQAADKLRIYVSNEDSGEITVVDPVRVRFFNA